MNDSVSHVKYWKTLQRINWNEIESTPQLRSGHPNPASVKLNPCLSTLCVLYLVWQQPFFLGEGRRSVCPLTAHSRVTVWKVHFDLCCWVFRIAPLPSTLPPSQRLVSGSLTFQMTSGHCPCQSGLAVWHVWFLTAVRSKHQIHLNSRRQRETEKFSCHGAAAFCSLLEGKCVHALKFTYIWGKVL